MALNLMLPEGFRYECERCGSCCGGWGIPVDAGDYSRIMDSGVASGRKVFCKTYFGKRRFMRLEKEHCVFINERNECGIYDVRPNVCRVYPLRLRDTPTGIFVGLSYSCPSVAYGRGCSIDELRGMIAALTVNRGVEAPVGDVVPFDGESSLRWDGYLAFEERLFWIISDGRLEDSLFSGWRLIQYLSDKLSYGLPAGRDEVNSIIDVFFGRGFDEVDDGLRKNVLSPVEHRLALALNVLPVEVEDGILRGFFRTVVSYMRFGVSEGDLSFKTKPKRFSISELGGLEYSFGEYDDYVRKYFMHFVFRKDLLYGLNILENYRVLVLAYALSKWYSVLNAHFAGRTKPSFEDVVEAVRYVERNYILHSNRLSRALSRGFTASVYGKYLEDPRFVPTMLYASPLS